MKPAHMGIYKRIVTLLNRFKQVFYYYDDEDFSASEKEYIDNIKKTNPYGILVLIFGGVSFTFGPQYIILPIATLTIAILTFGTFDKEKEDNPWTFMLGSILSLIGLYMYIVGAVHILI
ncbi:cell division protein FtsK [Rossellomorea aquimaris]|nr:cell division protein FtsK [Rossellomorea aquimaris]WRP07418.1 cell division protein FtsK [Rossellomorea aquimaris]